MLLKKEVESAVEQIIYEFFGKGNLSGYERLIAQDVHIHCPKSWQEIHAPHLQSREVVKKIDQEYSRAFQIRSIKIHDLVSSENKLSVRWDFEGVHRGDFFAIPATQRPLSVSGQTLYGFNREGKVKEVWQSWDMLGLLSQIKDKIFLSGSAKEIDRVLKQTTLLSRQEKECLKYLLEGKTAKETALQMKLSFRTVEYYFENIKDKLSCFRKRDLFAYARLLEKHHLLN